MPFDFHAVLQVQELGFLQSTMQPYQSTKMAFERATSHIPFLFMLLPWENVNRSTVPFSYMYQHGISLQSIIRFLHFSIFHFPIVTLVTFPFFRKLTNTTLLSHVCRGVLSGLEQPQSVMLVLRVSVALLNLLV